MLELIIGMNHQIHRISSYVEHTLILMSSNIGRFTVYSKDSFNQVRTSTSLLQSSQNQQIHKQSAQNKRKTFKKYTNFLVLGENLLTYIVSKPFSIFTNRHVQPKISYFRLPNFHFPPIKALRFQITLSPHTKSQKSDAHQPRYYIYKVNTEKMASDKNKIVQNYCLDELRYSNPDQSEIWTAKHKILKKNFTLKRLKYRGGKAEGPNGEKLAGEKEEWDMQNLQRETEMLKRLNHENCPKCRKMIKTSNNIYLVYEEFPLFNLKEHLAKNNPNRQQKLELMLQIARTVREYHSLGIYILALSPYNIYVKDKNDVLLADWSLARSKEDTEKILTSFFTAKYECLAKEVSQQGTYSSSSDIYSLGKIFYKIQHSGYLQSPTTGEGKLHQIINQMTSDKPIQRPFINEVIKIIQDCGGFSKSHSTKSDVSQSDNKQSQHQSSRTMKGFKIKHTMSTPIEENDRSELLTLQKRNSDMPETSKSIKSNLSSTNILSDVRSTKTTDAGNQLQVSKRYETKTTFEPNLSMNYSRKTSKSRKISEHFDEAIRAGNKKRNLAFFLLDLAEFVIRIWICPELGYVLLKYSMLTMESILQQWQPQLWQNESGQQFIDIIKTEKQKFQNNLDILKQSFQAFQGDQLLKRQFDQPKVISQRYLKQKIREFAKEMVIYCEKYLSDKSSITKLIEYLFKTYMILKKIEEGSFQKFWDHIYVNDNAFLNNQKYLKDERNLGFRYLKSRIAEILRAK